MATALGVPRISTPTEAARVPSLGESLRSTARSWEREDRRKKEREIILETEARGRVSQAVNERVAQGLSTDPVQARLELRQVVDPHIEAITTTAPDRKGNFVNWTAGVIGTHISPLVAHKRKEALLRPAAAVEEELAKFEADLPEWSKRMASNDAFDANAAMMERGTTIELVTGLVRQNTPDQAERLLHGLQYKVRLSDFQSAAFRAIHDEDPLAVEKLASNVANSTDWINDDKTVRWTKGLKSEDIQKILRDAANTKDAMLRAEANRIAASREMRKAEADAAEREYKRMAILRDTDGSSINPAILQGVMLGDPRMDPDRLLEVLQFSNKFNSADTDANTSYIENDPNSERQIEATYSEASLATDMEDLNDLQWRLSKQLMDDVISKNQYAEATAILDVRRQTVKDMDDAVKADIKRINDFVFRPLLEGAGLIGPAQLAPGFTTAELVEIRNVQPIVTDLILQRGIDDSELLAWRRLLEARKKWYGEWGDGDADAYIGRTTVGVPDSKVAFDKAVEYLGSSGQGLDVTQEQWFNLVDSSLHDTLHFKEGRLDQARTMFDMESQYGRDQAERLWLGFVEPQLSVHAALAGMRPLGAITQSRAQMRADAMRDQIGVQP